MNIEILTPDKSLFKDDVYGVQLPGVAGLFEILEKHAPMVSALGKGTIKVLLTKTETKSFTIASGFVEVLNNKVSILVEGASANS